MQIELPAKAFIDSTWVKAAAQRIHLFAPSFGPNAITGSVVSTNGTTSFRLGECRSSWVRWDHDLWCAEWA